MTEEVWFVANPQAGTLSGAFKRTIYQYIKKQSGAVLKLTHYPGHATEIAREAVKLNIGTVVAVGGDGTMNEVARGLTHSETQLGIVPCGSGNGLARHLGISLDPIQAINFALNPRFQKSIDGGMLNDIPFFCTAGVGFDAEVAHTFAYGKFRGLWAYVWASVKTLVRYKSILINASFNNQVIANKLFTLTIANAGQYGNDAWIAPQAIIDDGKLDLCLASPVPLWKMPKMLSQIFNKSIQQNSNYRAFEIEKLELTGPRTWHWHFDGEPLTLETERVKIQILHKVLKVIG